MTENLTVEKVGYVSQLKLNFDPKLSLQLGNSSVYTTDKFKFDYFQQEVECHFIFCLISCDVNDTRISLQMKFDKLVRLENITVVFNVDENRSEGLIFDTKESSFNPYTLNFKEIFVKTSYDPNNTSWCHTCDNYYSSTINQLSVTGGSIYYNITSNTFGSWKNWLKYLNESKDYSDMTITVNENFKFPVHKNIITHKSDVLKRMIDADMQEKKLNNIQMFDVDPVILQEILNYIYEGSCDFSRGVHEMFRFAHMYEIKGLMQMCENYLLNNINVANVVDTLKLVDIESYDLSAVKKEAENFLTEHEDEVVNNENFVNYLMDNMKSDNIHYIFRLSVSYNLNILSDVKIFIKKNSKEVFKNNEFRKLLLGHPEWSLDLLEFYYN